MNLNDWYKRKRAEVESTGWRPHGLQVGDPVRLCMGKRHSAWQDDNCWIEMEINGRYEDCYAHVEIPSGSIGKVVALDSGDTVRAVFNVGVEAHGETDFVVTSIDYVIRLNAYIENEYDEFAWFEPVKRRTPNDNQLAMF